MYYKNYTSCLHSNGGHNIIIKNVSDAYSITCTCIMVAYTSIYGYKLLLLTLMDISIHSSNHLPRAPSS